MDIGYTYATRDRKTVSLYAPPDLEPPTVIALTQGMDTVVARRVSDRSLICRDVPAYVDVQGNVKKITGSCKDENCHRRELGRCQCGRHPGEVPFERVGS